ncbi:MAG: 2-C-methyl-D-erythritol 2,4-cyclodiphosphate synthase [Actinomycetes bacterium]
MRIGQGFDIHRFSDDPDRPLVLAGVTIPGSAGLAGHSDADAATHALCDALLGAAGLGDLGTFFPDQDPSFAGADSLELLRQVMLLVAESGFEAINGDITVVAERPKLAPHREAMVATLSEITACPISVKASTAEGLGPIGTGEGIAAMAVVLLMERSSS